MEVLLFKNFSKKKNSTKRPELASGISANVKLKGACSIENPTFLIDGIDLDVNYLKWYDHYYFIDDIILSINNIYELRCSEDHLATFKTSITSSTQFVLYDTSENTNDLIDSRIPPITDYTYSYNKVLLRDDINPAGNVVVSVNGKDCVGSFVIPEANLNRLIPDVFDVFEDFVEGNTVYDAIIGGFKQLVASGGVTQNIRCATWVPFTLSPDQTQFPVVIGRYETDIGGGRIINRISQKSTAIAIPWQFEDWRNCEPYTYVYLYIPFVGVVNYPTSSLKGSNELQIYTSLNRLTGEISISVECGSGHVLGTYGASTGTSVPIGSSNLNPIGTISNAINAVAQGFNKNVTGAAASLLQAVTPQSVSIGGISNGSATGLDLELTCFTICHDTTTEPSSVSSIMGTPTFEVKSLSGLTGFCQCEDATLSLNSLGNEKDTVISYMNSGFFIE